MSRPTKQQVEDAMEIFDPKDYGEMAYYQVIADHLGCEMYEIFDALSE